MTQPPTDGLRVNDELSVPEWELTEQFVQASGPGGQNVNKVATAVQLRWNVDHSCLPEGVKARFRRLFSSRLTREGDIVIEARQYRSQAMNRADARQRLKGLIASAAQPPKKRIRTRPTAGSVRRRLKAKQVRGDVKALRGKVERDD